MSTVLVVDDDMDLLELYTQILEDMGHLVACAQDGVMALRLVAELRLDLILTDWRMPRMDGIELCKTLRRRGLLRGTRIALHSSELVPEPWQADVCLRKPGSPEDLEDLVRMLLAVPGDAHASP